ncbi:MAG TPA: phospholipid carrier-dependent glycosyltransferase [Xanthobacteraceae bacterium]|nr:phospholipid carrier-dependent glycosyltransferase [Xanthobacteraceae bacterium]
MSTTSPREERIPWPPVGVTAAIGYAATSHRRAALLLIVVALLAFLPGFFQLPPIDREEARVAQASKQMLESGDYLDIRFQEEIRYRRPAGIHWLQVAVVGAADALGVADAETRIWLYRIPSLLGAVGAVLLTYWAALAFVSRRAAVLAALMLATSLIVGVAARLATSNAMLLLTAVAAMGALARAYLGGRSEHMSGREWKLPAIFWSALAAGVLLRGPLILLFVIVTAATLSILDRSLRWLVGLRPLLGAAWFVLLLTPYVIATWMRGGEGFVERLIGEELLALLFGGRESRFVPPGYYFVLFWVAFWPSATLAGFAAPSVWAARHEPGAKFLLAWLVPSWIIFELLITKLPHYVLPLYPAVAILIAGILDPHLLARKRWMVRGTSWWFVLPSVLVVAAVVAQIVITRQLGLIAWPFAAGAMILGLIAWRLYEVDGAERSLLRAMAASILLALTCYGVIGPALQPLFPSAALARIVHDSDCKEPLAAAAGYHEPSLVFLVGTSTRYVDGAGAAEFLARGPCRFAFVEARHERNFAQRAEAIGLRYAPGPRIEGINYSTGRSVSIAVYLSERVP